MSKNKKKNLKKIRAKIDTKNTPVKTEAAKKEASKVANKNVDKAAKAAANRVERQEKQEKKYAASKARKEARNARKQTEKDMLNGVKHTKNSTPVKTTLEERKKRQEERRKIAYNRHIASIRRRCSRMHLSDIQTNAVIEKAKEQWDKAKSYNIIILCDSFESKRTKLLDIIKKHSIKAACITNCTAFLNVVPKVAVDEIREILPNATVYQYAEKTDLFKEYKDRLNGDKKGAKKGGTPHSIECSKKRSINFYKLRRLKKTTNKKTKETAKPVNKKPSQVKIIKEKSNKQAA